MPASPKSTPPPTHLPTLTVDGLTVRYAKDEAQPPAVRDISFRVPAGERLGLVGESGCGKTTTALAIMGLLRKPAHIASGSIKLDGRELVGLAPSDFRRLRLSVVSYVPQGAMNALNPVITIGEQIADGIIDHLGRKPRAAVAEMVAEALASVDLPADVSRRYPHELSGGMKQRACIAISSILRPKLLIADEPTSALDVITQREVMAVLGRRQRQTGSAMILIGHDMGLMAQFVDRLAVMYLGQIVELGPTHKVISEPQDPYAKALIRSALAMHGQFARAEEAADGA